MAYAALESLYTTLGSFYTRQNIHSKFHELITLWCTMGRLDDSCYRGVIDRSEINELEATITEAAWKLEDVLDSYQLSLGVDKRGMEQEIHSFLKTAEKLSEEYKRVLQNKCVAVAEEEEEDHIIHNHNAANSTTVGSSDLTKEIISGLFDDMSDCKMFTIWGMAGIGKTHLARNIYHHPLIVQYFELRLWVSIGPTHKDIKNIFVDILAQTERKPRDLFKEKDKDELRDLLWNSLLHRTYIIVFDDVWNMSVLGDCIEALPYEHDRGILMTTRLLDETEEWEGNKICQMPFLSDEESWNLLCQNVFAENPFPIQLEKAGRKIAEICEGLPLLILAVADILRGLDQTEEFWNMVAEKKTTTFPDAYDRIYKVLILSYDYLFQCYKACFLYIGVFRQSHEIPVSKLTRLWIVEGFVQCVDALRVFISSSLVIPCKRKAYSALIKSCKLHSAYWYVCVTEARKNKLFHVLNKLADVFIENPRRLSVQNNMLFGIKEVYDSMAAVTSLTRSLLFTGEDHQYPVQICFNTMLLMKVLDTHTIRFYEFPNEVSNLLLLKYLALTHNGKLPSSISKLQRLHYLFLRRHHTIIKLVQGDSTTSLPKEIWDLQHLFHLRITGSKLPDPSRGVELPRLSNLYVNANSCTEGVLRGTPALMKLGIEIELEPEGGTENSLRCLLHTWAVGKLESVKCEVVNPRLSSQVVAPRDHLPYWTRSLKKLSLKGLGYPWQYMSSICSLPNLQVLKLRCYAFRGPVWDIKDGQFTKLRYLLLEDLDVVHLTVEGCLPDLDHLIVRHCYKLKMISYSYIQDMKRIEVDECSPSIVEFAQQIKDNSNPSRLTVVINSSWNL